MTQSVSPSHDLSAHIHALDHFPLHRPVNNFRYHKNPILKKGNPGEWDDAAIRDPMILYDNTAPPEEKFRLYYCGASTKSEGQMQIGLAYGPALEHLTKYPGNPVVTMTETWENAKIDPAVPGGEHAPLNHTPYVFQIPGSHQY